MIRNRKMKRLRAFCLLLALAVVCTVGLLPEVNASAAETPTSLGFAAHGIKAHRDGWLYVYGGKGEVISGKVRGSDCAGLLYAYFSDVGALGNCRGGATTQVEDNCVFSNDISEGIPNIHGLALTMPDYHDPGSGIYGHIGIYIGNNEAADNSDTNYNMRREPVIGSDRNWNAWHVFDNGMKYPVDGWYQLDGKMVHYTRYEYDVSTTIDGYRLGSDGYACDETGKPAPVNTAILSTQYASATQVASYLRTKYSGRDSTYELIYGGTPDPAPGYNGRVTGSEVRLRQAANTSSGIVTVLSRGSSVNILEEVTGETISGNGTSTNKWYSVVTANGQSGYICSLYVERLSDVSPTAAPVIKAANGYVTITAAPGMDIYYTTDCSSPTELSTPYTAPVYLTGYTFKAIAVGNGVKTPVATATVLSNSSVFTDFTTKSWYFPVVDQAVSDQIFRGAGDGTFHPTEKITRAQFVMALANLDRADLSLYEGGTSFSDLAGLDARTKLAVSWASEHGYVTGAGNGTFRPLDPISREQMCTILARYAGLERDDSSPRFADDGQISAWAKDAVYACRDKELISGIGNNRFDPRGTASRAEACVVTTNLYHSKDVPVSQ